MEEGQVNHKSESTHENDIDMSENWLVELTKWCLRLQGFAENGIPLYQEGTYHSDKHLVFEDYIPSVEPS